MKAGKYSVKDLFVNRYVSQIVIPEIQRDYVWEKDQVSGLFNSILVDFLEYGESPESVPNLETEDHNLKTAFLEFYQKRYYSSNIGFIYAYSDEQKAGNYYLIDGQQRITTVYLLLLSIASMDEGLKQDFKNTYCLEINPKIDYKVRESAHQFLECFVNAILEGKEKIENQSWYYKNQYDADTTIKSIINNYAVLKELVLSSENIDINKFYYFLENFVDFWYFDTNVSEQGEELYIYMNARGEQIQGNENIKADLLGQLNTKFSGEELVKIKNHFGTSWENWQDYFWRNRGGNENADNGFNEFLACISGLRENAIKKKNKFYTKEQFEKKNKIDTPDLISALDLEFIKTHIEVLHYISEKKETFKELYNYSDWVNDCFAEIWKLLNDNNINWYADFNDPNRATERNRMVFLWSIFHYVKKILTKSTDSDDLRNISNVFRFMRMFYLRYKNNNRSVSTLIKAVDLIYINGILDSSDNVLTDHLDDYVFDAGEESTDYSSLTKEEVIRAEFLQIYLEDPKLLRQFEAAIWKIEDHKFNLDGSDVGATNFSHFVDLNSEMELDRLRLIGTKFYEIFPIEKRDYKEVQSVLLYYGKYWRRVSPWYYRNYKFDDWKRIVRNICIGEENGESPFKDFFNEFLDFSGNLDDFLKNKRKRQIDKNKVEGIRGKFIWYNENLNENMWKTGNHIVISNGEYCSLPDWEGKDINFPEDYIIYNIDKNLKGGEKRELGKYIKSESLPIV